MCDELQANGPAGGGFNRAFVDEFLGGMACGWPGVRHVVVHESAQAAEHVAGLTRALAEQPFRVEVRTQKTLLMVYNSSVTLEVTG